MLSDAPPSTFGVPRDPENAHLMTKAGERQRKRFSVETKRVERKKNGRERQSPSPSTANSNQGRVNNALSARRKPLQVVWIKEIEGKRTLGSPNFDIMP